MNRIFKGISRIAECVAAMALAAIFIIFLLQIFTRYAPKISWLMPIPPLAEWMAAMQPIGWTVNLISLIWVWVIFFGCAFFVRQKDHVAFDIFYLALPRSGRAALSVLGAIILIGVMLYSFGPTWDAIMGSRLMELKKIQTLRLPITGDKIAVKWMFVSYIVLMVAVISRAVWQICTVLRFGVPTEPDEGPHPEDQAQ